MFFDTLLDIMNLTPVAEKVADEAQGHEDLLKTIAIVGSGLFGPLLLIAAVFLYLFKRTQNTKIRTIRNYLYYKVPIQYFKAVFITLLLDHLLQATRASAISSVLPSVGVLLALSAILLYFLAVLTLRG
jgi:hypothetical protein